MWKHRYLSLFGRIEIIKTLAISRLVYCLTLLPSPGLDFLNTIEKLLFNFVWQDKPARVRSSVLKNSLLDGGAAMPDLKLKNDCLKLGWLHRLIHNSGAWKQFVLKNIGIDEDVLQYYLTSNVHSEDLSKEIKSMCFWDKTFKDWCTINYTRSDECITIDGILSAHLCYQKFFDRF